MTATIESLKQIGALASEYMDRRAKHRDFFRVADGLLAGNAEIDDPYDDEDEDSPDFGETLIVPGPLHEANVVTSHFGDGDTHKIAIDLDMDAALIPTSTPGHHHLIVNHELPWDAYAKLLTALNEAGLIQDGYLKASLIRGATVLRTPWTKKETE